MTEQKNSTSTFSEEALEEAAARKPEYQIYHELAFARDEIAASFDDDQPITITFRLVDGTSYVVHYLDIELPEPTTDPSTYFVEAVVEQDSDYITVQILASAIVAIQGAVSSLIHPSKAKETAEKLIKDNVAGSDIPDYPLDQAVEKLLDHYRPFISEYQWIARCRDKGLTFLKHPRSTAKD